MSDGLGRTIIHCGGRGLGQRFSFHYKLKAWSTAMAQPVETATILNTHYKKLLMKIITPWAFYHTWHVIYKLFFENSKVHFTAIFFLNNCIMILGMGAYRLNFLTNDVEWANSIHTPFVLVLGSDWSLSLANILHGGEYISYPRCTWN